jgi:hypothetical protein
VEGLSHFNEDERDVEKSPRAKINRGVKLEIKVGSKPHEFYVQRKILLLRPEDFVEKDILFKVRR